MLNNVGKSINKATIAEARKLNLLLSAITFLCAMFLLFLLDEALKPVILIMTIKSGGYMLATSTALVAILQHCASKYSDQPHIFRARRYVYSYAVGISIYLLMWPVFGTLANLPLHLDSIKHFFGFSAVAAILTTIILYLHDFIILRHTKTQTDLENARLQTKNAEAENLILKQQIHPHFLFNALSTLKSLYKKDLVLGEKYLIQLADFLRTAVSHNQSTVTTLEEELIICKNYLEMQKIRFAETLEWEIIINDPQHINGHVLSFSLQPLLENAIKHNVLTKQNPLKITIEQSGQYIWVSNNVNSRKYSEASTKSGLANLAERYSLWTGDDIDISNDGTTFSVRFKINTHENTDNRG